MKRITRGLLIMSIAAGATSCSKFNVPKLSMPQVKLFKQQTPQQKAHQQIATVLKAPSDAQFYREMATLLELAQKLEWDNIRLLNEVLDYQPSIDADGQLPAYQRMLDLLRVPRSAVVAAAAERLATAKGKQAEICRMLLHAAAPADPRGAAEFSQFAPYLSANRARPPQHLILWMYKRDPAAAMEQMLTLYGERLSPDEVRTLHIAARVLDQMAWKQRYGLSNPGDTDALAVEQIEKLVQFEQWWVRLYAAEMLVKYPQLRKAEVVSQLTTDADPMVASVAGRIGQ